MLDSVDCVVVGAGVVGLAVARALAQRGREVLVLEAENAIGTGISSRNSEVIHAGIYYPTGSLKARLCVQGQRMLYAYCAERSLPHQRCGKLVVATSAAQQAQLKAIAERGAANGVADLQWLTRSAARQREPALECVAALYSPSTGIVDSHALMLSLQGDLEQAGGMVACHTPLLNAQCAPEGIVLAMQDGTRLKATTVVNAAGLDAPRLARQFAGLDPRHVPQDFYAKGSYFSLKGKTPFSHLIYPVPETAGLGVHLTLDLGGQAKFGPDVQWVTDPADLDVQAQRSAVFYDEVRKYWPQLPDDALVPAYAGMRPKIHGPTEPAADFCVQTASTHGVRSLINLFGIESPGLTSALALGEHVANLAGACRTSARRVA